MKTLFLFAFVFLNAIVAFSQSVDTDNNVVISQSQREFRFVTGNETSPVLIKEKSSRTYFCNNYRAEIPIAEFYDNMETVDDIDIRVDQSKRHDVIPKNDYYSSEGIFYSDARICHFSLPLVKKGSTSKVVFEKTVLDPHYFTTVHFLESQAILEQEIKIVVPNWIKLEIKEFNFSKYNIRKTVTQQGEETVYTYYSKNLPAIIRETSSPGLSYYAPHILVMCKSAKTKETELTYFNSLKDQYSWYRQLILQIGNEEKPVKDKALEIIGGLKSDSEKVKVIYQWVQDNIRYIAFEDGIAGFKPEKAQEVLRKKYGDCKGMANLVTEMLRSVGIDARRCWIGTKHLAYDYSTPSLIVDNHMISVWINAGKPVFLDATEKYIGFGEVAERIQGRQVLIEDGINYKLEKVPVANHTQNTAHEKRALRINGTNLEGHVFQSWKGENKVWLLTEINNIKQERQEKALIQYLSESRSNYEISGIKILNLNDYNKDLNVEYDIKWKNVISEFGKEMYLEINNRRNLESLKIDTASRKLPYWFRFKNHLVFETELELPESIKPSELPASLNIKRNLYSFTGSFQLSSAKLIYRCEIMLNKTEINTEDFSQWNNDIDQLSNFYNQQLVLTKTK